MRGSNRFPIISIKCAVLAWKTSTFIIMLGLTILLLVGSYTLTMGIWCKLKACPPKVDVHCGEVESQNCEHTAKSYCLVKKEECIRIINGAPKFSYIVRGKCFYNKPPCHIYRETAVRSVSTGNINTSFENVSSSSNSIEDLTDSSIN